MKCPKCRSEIGNQPVCPYCGGTVYVQAAPTWTPEEYANRTVVPGRQHRSGGMDLRELDRRLHNLETRVNLALILLCGSFALLVLALVVLALK